MNLQMDPLDNPLDNPLTTHPIQTGCEMFIEPYLNWRLGCIDDPDRQFGNGLVPTRSWTQSARLEPLLPLQSEPMASVKFWKWYSEELWMIRQLRMWGAPKT